MAIHVKKHIWKIFLVGSLAVNIVAVYTLLSAKTQQTTVNWTDYPYLSRRIFTEQPADVILNFINLRKELHGYIKSLDTRSGLYFEYLPSGISIGINEKEEFRLASLAKIPTVMATYKQIALGNLKRTDTFTIEKDNIDNKFGTSWKKGAGALISVEDAIKFTLIESDNTAHNVLLAHLVPGALDEVYSSFDIPYASVGNFPAISAKNYSSILRSLYLSAYLPEEYSNEILEILTQSIYRDKIPAGISDTVKVAHKIGVVENIDPALSFFTDCGIVYVPKRPYILCIIVNGDDNDAQTYMSQISKIIYSYVAGAKSMFKL